jgi:hypothetical protein
MRSLDIPCHRAVSSPLQALYRRARRTKSQGRLRVQAQRPLPILGACSGEVRGTMGETGATPLSAYAPPQRTDVDRKDRGHLTAASMSTKDT